RHVAGRAAWRGGGDTGTALLHDARGKPAGRGRADSRGRAQGASLQGFVAAGGGLEATLLEQRFDLGIAAAEVAVERRHVLGAAARQDHVAEALAVLARHATVFAEPVVGVVVEHFAPEVGVVARRVPAAPHVRE